MQHYPNEYLEQLEQRLSEYLMEVNPATFSWGNKKDIVLLAEWVKLKDEQHSESASRDSKAKEACLSLSRLRRNLDEKMIELEDKGQLYLASSLDSLANEASETISFSLSVIHHLERENMILKERLKEKE